MTYEEFSKYIESKPKPKFSILVWKPKEHWQYWFYTIMLNLVPKKYKQYWFTKKCNFIHKPLMDALLYLHNG